MRGDLEVDVRDVGEAVVAALAHGGIDHLFFCSGTELAFYQEAIAKARALGQPAPRLIAMTHEYVCLNAALGYTAVSGRPAATCVHVDVGTQHQGAALHTAWRSGLPVIMTAGAPATSAPGTRGARDAPHFWTQQTYDQNGIVRQFTKWEHRLEYQDNPGLIVSRALQVAQTEPCGPVYLSLPREIVYRMLETTRFPTAAQLGIPQPAAPAAEAVREIAQRLVRARNPVIVAGGGRNPATVPALVALCELIGAPAVQCAWQSYQSFPFDHPLYQGKRSIAEFDVVLALECDVPWMPGPNAPAADAWVGVVDVDPIKQRIPTYEFTADLRVAADPLISIAAITSEVAGMLLGDDRARCAERARRWGEASRARKETVEHDARAAASKQPIDPRWLSYQIAQLLDDNSLVIDDTTHDRLFPYLRLSRPSSYFHNPGSSGGWAPGAALGAKLAAPERDVIAVTGDGFYMYGVPTAAIWAAVRHRAPFLTVVYQNRSYTTGTVAVAGSYPGGYAERSDFDGGYLEPAMDFAKEAEAAGGWGENVRDPAGLAAALRRGLAATRAGRPAVIAVWLPRLLRED
jgi:acetolactate synthase-1/2/3 large subunit